MKSFAFDYDGNLLKLESLSVIDPVPQKYQFTKLSSNEQELQKLKMPQERVLNRRVEQMKANYNKQIESMQELAKQTLVFNHIEVEKNVVYKEMIQGRLKIQYSKKEA